MEGLFVLQLLVCLVTWSKAEVGCRPAQGGNCVVVHLTQWVCAEQAGDYEDMMNRCCPQCTSLASSDCRCSYETNDPNTAASNCLLRTQQYNWNQPPCSDLTFLSSNSASPSQNILTLAPRPIHNASFNLTISWPEMSNVSGYVLAVKDKKYVLGNFSTNEPAHTSITLPNICYDTTNTVITIKLWKRVSGRLESVDSTSLNRANCYSLYDDPANQSSYCGPQVPEGLKVSDITVVSTSEGDGLFSANLSWNPVAEADSYEFKITSKQSGTKYYISVTNTNNIVLTGLILNNTYKVKIYPYISCAGMYKNTYWSPCNLGTAEAKSISQNTADITAQPPLDSSSTLFATSTNNDVPRTSLAASIPPSTALILSSSPTSSVTLNEDPQIPWFHQTSAIVWLTLPLSLLILAFLVALISCLAVYKKCCRKARSPSSTDIPLFPLTETPPLSPFPPPSPPFTPFGNGYVQQLPTHTHKVLVLYSQDTPEDQQQTINELLYAGLGQCDILVETPGTIPNRDFNRERVERAVAEASAVFFVCNDQFYREWMSDDPATSSGGGAVGGAKVGRDARMLKNAVNTNDLKKFAFVHFEPSDEEFDKKYPLIKTPFINRYFSLCGDKLVALHSVASFVKNIPKYELDTRQ